MSSSSVRVCEREREKEERFKLFVSFTVILARTKTSPPLMINNGEYKCIFKERGSSTETALGLGDIFIYLSDVCIFGSVGLFSLR